MNKKEKIIAICFAVSLILVIVSSIATLITNKPDGYKFNIEKVLKI